VGVFAPLIPLCGGVRSLTPLCGGVRSHRSPHFAGVFALLRSPHFAGVFAPLTPLCGGVRSAHRSPLCGGVRSAHRPLAPVLQIQNKPHAAHGIFVFPYTLCKRACNGFRKNKNPFRGVCFVLDQWSWRESNPRPGKETICFLHAYSCLIVGAGQVQNNRTGPYLLIFISRPETPADYSLIACVPVSGGLRS
jgi:hypothetical protein